ncbi:efflux RND transporter periplasmic adaptor subunit [Castellaniella caeni]|uniref:efflux RND transporter periplasmic adaptor subunit n=1 Tax=Castellaniella caeni TaxID=266123 RepID=UPI00082E4724|nr:efflux RND transporter periplasmic adaptor subunit [Castellaniella caeni]
MLLRRRPSVSLASVLFLAGVLASCGQRPQEVPPLLAPPPFATLEIEPQQVVHEQRWDGVIEAVQSTIVAAQTSGRVAEMRVDVGDHVKKGDMLLRLTDVEQQSARHGADAAVASARANRDEALANWKRASELSQRGLIARAQLDQALARRDNTEAALQAAQAALRAARQQTDYTVVRAPFDGVVTRRFADVGQAVQPAPPQPLIAVASLAALRVDVVVPQSAAAEIRSNPVAEVLPTPAHTERVRAQRVTVLPYADAASHTFQVRVDLPAGTPGLYPGMTVKVAFRSAHGSEQLLVPEPALVRHGEVRGVYVVGADNIVTLRQLRLGERRGDAVEVLSGLSAGERVAADADAAVVYLAKLRSNAGKTR